MNLVITFILIFYMLLIGSMAYTKAYKIKNYLLNAVSDIDEKEGDLSNYLSKEKFKTNTNDYLRKVGYILSSNARTCPVKNADGYETVIDTTVGSYDYCIYMRYKNGSKENLNDVMDYQYNYMVLVYMKFDFPIVGNFIKIPITGETKTITVLKK